MFVGSIGADLRSIIVASVRQWPIRSIYIGCSGNFTVERSLAGLGYELSGNDVSLYSCCIGSYLAQQPFALQIRDLEYEWLLPWLADPASAVAAILLCTRMLEGYGKDEAYWHRQRAGYRRQWERLHAETLARVQAVGETLHLKQFWPGDVMEWLQGAPEDVGFITFPPTYAAGYERLWRSLEAVFDWDEPAYQLFDEERMALMRRELVRRPYWLFARDEPQPDVGAPIAAVQSTNRSKRLWVYGNAGGLSWFTMPAQKTETAGAPIGDESLRIGPDTRLSIAPLTMPQFNELRSLYLNPGIAPANPTAAVALLADGVIIGCLGFTSYFIRREVGRVYMMTDFPVRPTPYGRLAKLILAAALSTETQLWLQRCFSSRVRVIGTTAFTELPASAKYRGLFRLTSRKKDPPRLNYQAETGRWSLERPIRCVMTASGT